MKKILALLLSLTFLVLSAPGIHALTCEHNYQSTLIPATCISRAKTVYKCSLCGDTYETTAPLYTAPDTLYVLLESSYSGNKLTVTVRLGNNPGIYSSLVAIGFNSDALQALSVTNGNVWADTEARTTITSSYLKQFCESTAIVNNYKNGLLFTVEFNVLKPMQDWGIYVTCNPKNFVNVNVAPNNVTIINTVTLGYGDHSWDEGTVTLEPSLTSEGVMTHSCLVCNHTKTTPIPALTRYTKGDINNDSRINIKDIYNMKQYIKGMITFNLQEFDAADINSDGRINMKDLYEIKTIIKGIS